MKNYTQEDYDEDVQQILQSLVQAETDTPDEQDTANAYALLCNVLNFRDEYWNN